MTNHWHSVRPALWIGLPFIYLARILPHLNDFAWNYDEGVLLQTAVLVNKGYPLYTETVFNKPPLIIWWIGAAFSFFGESLIVARGSMLFLTVLTLLLIGHLASLWFGQWSGISAMGLYLLVPEAVERGAVVMNDLPAFTLFLLTCWCATKFQRSQRHDWEIGAGIAFGLTIGLHPLFIVTGLPILLLLIWPAHQEKWQLKRAVLTAVWFGLACLATTAIWLLLVDWNGFYLWVIEFNSAPLDETLRARLPFNDDKILEVLRENWGLVLTAVFSTSYLWVKGKSRLFLALTWMIVILLLLAMLNLQPLWRHYVLLAILPLILPAAGGVVALFTNGAVGQRRTQAAAALLLLILTTTAVFRPPLWQTWSDEKLAMVDFIQQQISAEGFVLTDDPFLMFAARRTVAPPLTDSSTKRLSTRFLTPADLTLAWLTYPTPIYVDTSGRFDQRVEFRQWAEQKSFEVVEREELQIFSLLPPPDIEPFPAPVVIFENGLTLAGYTNQFSDGKLTLQLLWQTKAPQNEDYHFFIHVVDQKGQIITQYDGQPFRGDLPTSRWPVDMLLPETIELPLFDLGETEAVLFGVYRWPDLARLTAVDADNQPYPDNLVPLNH